MEINILAFGQISEIVGKQSWKLSDVNTTDELRKKLTELFPALIEFRYSIAVNKNIFQNNTELKQDDTVALLPPFSGG